MTRRVPSLRNAVHMSLAAAAVAAEISSLCAQQPPASVATVPEEVVVTGSRVQAPADISVSPITSVSAPEIAQTGLTRTEDVLNTLPMVFANMNSNVSNGADGTAAVNLRGLGNQRTLVLVDGLRLGPGSADGRNWSDLNMIPAALIERIDVLTGGASAVYGADAVAGVVNFIMNTHFTGIRVDAGYHFNQHDNADQDGVGELLAEAGDAAPHGNVNTAFGKNLSVAMGSDFADQRGNASGYITYDNQGPALLGQLDYSACALGPVPFSGPPYTGLSCNGSSVSRGGEFLAFGTTGVTLINHTVDPGTGIFRPFAQPNDLYNFATTAYLQTPNERWTAGAFVNYDLNQHARVYTSFMFMRNSMAAQIAPGGDFGQPSFIPCADPLLTAQEAATLCTPANLAANGGSYEVYNGKRYPGLNMYIARRNVEGGGRIAAFVNDAARVVLGLKGDFAAGWTYDAHAQRGMVDIADGEENYLGNSQLQQALNVLSGPNGLVCGGPTGSTGPLVSAGTAFVPASGCVPWNIWVPHGVTPAALAYMTVPQLTSGGVTEQVVSGSVTGNLGRYGLRLPSAPEGPQLNVGAEWREEQPSFVPDLELQQGNAGGDGSPEKPVTGEFTVRELFAEMRLPLAAQQMFADDLFMEGGYRYSRYSQGVDTQTYKLGLEWAPTSDVRLRGGYQRAVRAPNIAEFFTPQSVSGDGSIDPCAGTPSASLAACELTGVKPGQYGHILASPSGIYNGLQGGNPQLQPEVADTYTAGFVLTPRVVQNLQVSADYFSIRVKGVMGVLGADAIMLDCLASSDNLAQQARFCPLIHRDTQGTLWLSPSGYISDLTVNEGQLSTAGLDVAGTYRVSLAPAGSLTLALIGTRLRSLQTTPVDGFGSYDCAGFFGANCNVTPRWRHVLNANWSTPWSGFDLHLRWRYVGTVNSELTSTNQFLGGIPYLPLAHIPAYNYFDVAATLRMRGSTTLELGINNIADKAPPLVVGGDCASIFCNGNTFPGVYDAMGRYLFMHLAAEF